MYVSWIFKCIDGEIRVWIFKCMYEELINRRVGQLLSVDYHSPKQTDSKLIIEKNHGL